MTFSTIEIEIDFDVRVKSTLAYFQKIGANPDITASFFSANNFLDSTDITADFTKAVGEAFFNHILLEAISKLPEMENLNCVETKT